MRKLTIPCPTYGQLSLALFCILLAVGVMLAGCASPPPPPPPPIYSLFTLVSPQGSGSISPSRGTYNSGDVVTLTATPSPGYEFVSWSSDVSGTSPTITINMNSNKSMTANFQVLVEKSPPITIALDYFGIRNTHGIPQGGGGALAKIQLIAVVSDEQGTLAVWPPQNVQNLTFDMDYFQVEALKEKMTPPVIFNDSVTGTLVVYIAAYNVNKGEITKAQIDILSKWLGLPDLNKLKDVIPGRELVGYYWQTWAPLSNWGVGERYDGKGDGDLAVWFRIWSNNEPQVIPKPDFSPEIKITNVTLPFNAKPGWVMYPITLSLENKEQLDIRVKWEAYSSTTGKFDSGEALITKNNSLDIRKSYLWEAGNRTITYKVYYGNTLLDTWSGTLNVIP